MKPQRIPVTCPRCGNSQQEPTAAYSTRCRKCGEHFRLEDVVRPAAARGADALLRPAPRPGGRLVACFQCGTMLDVPPSAQSTMCKRCSSHVDLRDYDITKTESKNFRTRGRFVIHEGGCLLNTDTSVQDAILKGKVIGKLTAEGTLEIHRTGEIKGSFKAGILVIPSDTIFRWPDTISLGGADIHGELQANVFATGTVVLRSAARFFGNIQAAAMQVESGAVVVGKIQLGSFPAPSAAPAPSPAPASASIRPVEVPARPEKGPPQQGRLFDVLPEPPQPVARIH